MHFLWKCASFLKTYGTGASSSAFFPWLQSLLFCCCKICTSCDTTVYFRPPPLFSLLCLNFIWGNSFPTKQVRICLTLSICPRMVQLKKCINHPLICPKIKCFGRFSSHRVPAQIPGKIFFPKTPRRLFFAPLNLPNWRRKELVIIKRVPPQLRLLQHRKENFIPLPSLSFLLLLPLCGRDPINYLSNLLRLLRWWSVSLTRFLKPEEEKEWCGFRPGFSAGIFWRSWEGILIVAIVSYTYSTYLVFYLFRNFYVKLNSVLLSALSFAPPPLRILVVRWTDFPPALGPPLSSPSSSLHSEWSFSPPYIIM